MFDDFDDFPLVCPLVHDDDAMEALALVLVPALLDPANELPTPPPPLLPKLPLPLLRCECFRELELFFTGINSLRLRRSWMLPELCVLVVVALP